MDLSSQGVAVDRGAGTTLAERGPLPIGLRWPRPGPPLVWLLAALFALAAVRAEVRTSRVQALAAAHFAGAVGSEVLGGKNPALPPATAGPYDRRLGYAGLGEHVARLEAAGFRVSAQAQPTARAEGLAALGLPAIYAEKSRAGLEIVDRAGMPLAASLYPRDAYADFLEIPGLVTETLLFIENRALLAPGYRYRSPVIEWERFAHAAWLQLLPRGDGRRPGASTLATQIEKYRHSPSGVTASVPEKLRQIAAATLRAYHAGPETSDTRRRIVTDYVNTVPLAARAGFGEVHGIPDGLAAWFGADFREASQALADGPPEARALAYRRVLSLFLAQRRPSHYLLDGRADLHALVDAYLPRLVSAGVIDPALADATRATDAGFASAAPRETRSPFVERKPVDSVRGELVSSLGLAGTYDLDRMDLAVATTLDAGAQARVNDILRQLGEPEGLGATLRQPRLLEDADPARVVYSFLLYERAGGVNRLRVQADTLDQPFNVNDGMKLDLGSTAKLRTLVHYLELVAAVHDRHAGRPPEALAAVAVHPRDGLTRFVVDALRARPKLALSELVEAALDRPFPARPGRFFTGGGSHAFSNYEDAFDGADVPLRIALRHSVNLPFVRLMREMVDHVSFGPGGAGGRVLDDRGDPARAELLARFAERESLDFLATFAARHRMQTPLEREALLAGRTRRGAFGASILYRSLHPDGDVDALHRFLARQLPGQRFDGEDLRRWHAQADPHRLSLADRSWLTGLHPLELWLVRYWSRHPDAADDELRRASALVRREAYAWLERAGKGAQDLRIRTELEREAFREIHTAWARTGYPFASLVPSLATAIGSSADRPAALATLLGIIQNDGMRLGARRIEEIRLAGDTPYETRLAALDPPRERVLRPEVARAVRAALLDVVENGTARRAYGALRDADGALVPIGGKTGTGDDRRKRFGRDGRLLSSEVANRSATLAFLVGDRHFGVLTAYVEGAEAEAYGFTSSLPAHVLRLLAPAIQPLVTAEPPHGMQALRPPARRERGALALGSGGRGRSAS